SANLAQYYVQAIAVAQYKNLTLNSGTTVTPPVYNATNYVGGIVALMCSDTLKFNGGHISLTDKGILTGNSALRPTTNNDPVGDLDAYSGWENSDTRIHFMLNCGDGAAFIVAKTMTCSTSSRIGNTATRGYQFYRGSSDSTTYNEVTPSNLTNVGGSTIFVVAQTIQSFTPYMFAKYRSSSSTAGQGICRCYIASETKLRNDEGLYAYDCISDKTRVIKQLGIKKYGNGSFGNMTNVTTQLNNYAKVTAISGNKVTYTGATTSGLAPITTGALVMIHWNHKNSTTVAESGRFYLANVLEEYNGVLTLDCTLPSISTSSYACQVVSIPQAKNFTLSTTNNSTLAYDGSIGGICAISVSETCNLSSGKINVEAKGGGSAYSRAGLEIIGNAQDCDKLPIGQGNGSVFILAKKLTMNSSTRIGGTGNGATVQEKFICNHNNGNPLYIQSGGYVGGNYNNSVPVTSNVKGETCGSGANGGYMPGSSFYQQFRGGYGSNGQQGYYKTQNYYLQGAHILIVAHTINTFSLSAIVSGGGGEKGGRAGYGSKGIGYESSTGVEYYTTGGGYNGGGAQSSKSSSYSPDNSGGSSGWAFIYCNEVVNQDTSGTVLAN
ncbi:MAG: hypothetical protein IKN27_10060, partial [Selenomonadaceae bacterium]|nr:hypothetical protein [Selenomonadaceae bacterium]